MSTLKCPNRLATALASTPFSINCVALQCYSSRFKVNIAPTQTKCFSATWWGFAVRSLKWNADSTNYFLQSLYRRCNWLSITWTFISLQHWNIRPANARHFCKVAHWHMVAQAIFANNFTQFHSSSKIIRYCLCFNKMSFATWAIIFKFCLLVIL